jgi:hypothetical protein
MPMPVAFAQPPAPKKFTAQEVIEAGNWATCRLCADAFRRRVETARYCKHCGNGFCEGYHGSFAFGHGCCVVCGAGKTYPHAAIYKNLQGDE